MATTDVATILEERRRAAEVQRLLMEAEHLVRKADRAARSEDSIFWYRRAARFYRQAGCERAAQLAEKHAAERRAR